LATKVDVLEMFNGVMANTMNHVHQVYGEKAMQQLFFELYSHTFSYLDREHGFDAVEGFWDFIADQQLGALESLIREKGFKGMEEYWRNTLDQEGADYEMQVSDDHFRLTVIRCPPTEWFKLKNIDHYPRYCEHCEWLYRRVGERCGFKMEYFPPDKSKQTCCGFHFTRGSLSDEN